MTFRPRGLKGASRLVGALGILCAGCLLDHERETRPGKVYKADCRNITGDYPDPLPPIPGKDSIACRVMEESHP